MNTTTKLVGYKPEEQKYLPPELLFDPNNPANDTFIRSVGALKNRIGGAIEAIKPLHVMAARAHILGESNVKISERLDVTPQTISRILREDKVKALIFMLNHLTLLMDGPNKDQRRNMLWRIAADSEMDTPKVAISAITEINRMNHTYDTAPNTTFTLNINTDALPKTALDG